MGLADSTQTQILLAAFLVTGSLVAFLLFKPKAGALKLAPGPNFSTW